MLYRHEVISRRRRSVGARVNLHICRRKSRKTKMMQTRKKASKLSCRYSNVLPETLQKSLLGEDQEDMLSVRPVHATSQDLEDQPPWFDCALVSGS